MVLAPLVIITAPPPVRVTPLGALRTVALSIESSSTVPLLLMVPCIFVVLLSPTV